MCSRRSRQDDARFWTICDADEQLLQPMTVARGAAGDRLPPEEQLPARTKPMRSRSARFIGCARGGRKVVATPASPRHWIASWSRSRQECRRWPRWNPEQRSSPAPASGSGRRSRRSLLDDGWSVVAHVHHETDDPPPGAIKAVADLADLSCAESIFGAAAGLPPVRLLINNAARFAWDGFGEFDAAAV